MKAIREFLCTREDGATAVEYAIMVSFIAAVIVVAFTTFAGSVGALFQRTLALWPH